MEALENEHLKNEISRQFRVIDQMLTAHCLLKERFSRKAKALDILILILSALLVATVFLDSKVIAFFTVDENFIRILIGIFSILVFCLTLVQFKVDWKQCADQHQKAFEVLSNYKLIYRKMRNDHSLDINDIKREIESFNRTISFLCTIPEKQFVSLKSKHLKKVILSKLVSRNPATSPAILKLYILFKGNQKKIKF